MSKVSCVIVAYVLLRPAFTPCGCSLVNLIEDCNKLIENFGCGSVLYIELVRNYRKLENKMINLR